MPSSEHQSVLSDTSSRCTSTHNFDRLCRANRPNSTPAGRYRVTYADNATQQRPKTASLITHECERLGRVERESVRMHRFKSHLPQRKDKPAPWQAQLEGTQKPVHVAPGYILSRSKSKYQMVINDKLFEQQEAQSKQSKQTRIDPEIEDMLATLKEQVADLSLHLEEERMNHRDTKRKGEDILQDKVEEMRRDHKEAVRRLTDEHDELVSTMSESHKEETLSRNEAHDARIARYRTELSFLQGAFESYKSQSNSENQNLLKELRAELEKKHALNLQGQLHDLGKKLTNEKHAALAAAAREQNKAISNLQKQCDKEIESLNRRFSNHATDIRKLKDSEAKHKEVAEKYEDTCKRNEACEKELANTRRESAEYKARLSVYDSDFQEKVAEVDTRYKAQMAELMRQNTELRKQYMAKCDQLFTATAAAEQSRHDQLQTSKETMKVLIQSRSNAYVNIAASDPKIKRSIPKERPCSAPATRKEEYTAAAAAGETDQVLARRETPFVRPQSVLELSAVFNTQELDVLTDEELETGLGIPHN